MHVVTLYVAVVILLLTVGLGLVVDARHRDMHQQQREILLGLERMQRHSQNLTQLLSTAVLERNALRISGYANTQNDLQNALERVAQEAQTLNLSGEVVLLIEENLQLRTQESRAIDLMRRGSWEAAREMLFGDDYLRARKIYEINTDTTVMAVTGEVRAMAGRIDRWRQVFTVLRIASLLMLLWAGAMFSRQIRSELALQERLRAEVTAANQTLEQRVTERTAELQQANEKLERLSITDGLTGLYNRRHFDQVFETEWQRAVRHGEPLAVVMIDVDEFKAYNDHYGHQAGDQCLREVAGLMREHNRRAGDVSARYGGEEFVVLLPGTEEEQAVSRAQALRSDIELKSIAHKAAKTASVVTLSAGVASWVPQRGDNPYDMLKAADDALYQAKHQGRNRVVVSPVPALSG